MSLPKSDELVALAKITKTQGLKGEFRAFPFSGESENLLSLKSVLIEKPGGETACYTVERCRVQKGAIHVMKIEGIDTIDQAQDFVGGRVLARREDLAELDDGEYYWFELQGMRVIAADGRELGVVESIYATGSNDVFVVASENERRDIPYTDDAIESIDPDAGVIKITSLAVLDDK